MENLNDRSESIFKLIRIDSLLYILVILLNFSLIPIILRLSGVDIYGVWSALSVFIAYISLADVGFGIYLIKYAQKNTDDFNYVLSTAFLTSLFIVFSICFIVFLVEYINPKILVEYLNIGIDDFYILNCLMLWLIVSIPSGLYSSVLMALNKVYLSTLLTGANSIINLGITLFLLWRDFGLNGFIIAYMISNAIMILIVMLYVKCHYKKINISIYNFSFNKLKEMMRFSGLFFFARMAKLVRDNVDVILILHFIDAKAVVMYVLSIKLPLLICTLLSRMNGVITPRLSSYIEKKETVKIRDYFYLSGKLSIIISMFCFICIIYINEFFINLWVGHDLYAGSMFTVFAGLIMIKDTYINNIGMIILLSDKIAQQTAALFFEAILNICLSLVLIPKFGLTGALAATLFCSLFTSIYYLPKLVCVIVDLKYTLYFSNMLNTCWKSILVTIPFFIMFFYKDSFNLTVDFTHLLWLLSLWSFIFILMNYRIPEIKYLTELLWQKK